MLATSEITPSFLPDGRSPMIRHNNVLNTHLVLDVLVDECFIIAGVIVLYISLRLGQEGFFLTKDLY